MMILKKIVSVMMTAVLLCLVLASCAGNDNSPVYDDNNADSEQTAPVSQGTDYKTSYSLTDNLYDFQIEINGNVYDFPMTVAEFMKCGWMLGKYEEPEQMIGSGKEDLIWFESADGSQVNARVLNYSASEQAYSDCHVSGIIIARDEVKFNISGIKMAKGVAFGASSLDDIVAAFGEYKTEYDSDSYKIIEYSSDIYKKVSFYVYKDTGTLGKVDMQTNDKPKEEIKNEVYDELPDAVKNYSTPASEGKTPADAVIDIDGVLYQFPIPVSELLKNGWQIDKSKSDETVTGRRNGTIYLYKGEKKTDMITVWNYTEMNVPVENCLIDELSTHVYESLFVVPGFVDFDLTMDELQSLISSYNGTTEEQGNSLYVYFKSDDNSTYLNISFDKSDNKISYFIAGVNR